MVGNNPLTQAQADAGAVTLGGKIRGKDLIPDGRRDTRAGILNGYEDRTLGLLGGNIDATRLSNPVQSFRGIGDHIYYGLFQ
jgi:hypothetical protein